MMQEVFSLAHWVFSFFLVLMLLNALLQYELQKSLNSVNLKLSLETDGKKENKQNSQNINKRLQKKKKKKEQSSFSLISDLAVL